MRGLEKTPLEPTKKSKEHSPDLSLIVDEAFGGFLEILDQHSVADLAGTREDSFKAKTSPDLQLFT